MNKCNACKSNIVDTKCDCGIWLPRNHPDIQKFEIFREVLAAYRGFADQKELPDVFTCDIPEDNIRAMFFVGTADELEMLKNFFVNVRALITNKIKEVAEEQVQ
jgi:hypothetical protein